MNKLKKYLQGGDLRTIGNVEKVISLVNSQVDFDLLFSHLFSTERIFEMRAADAIEKITAHNPQFLDEYKNDKVSFFAKLKTMNLNGI